MSLGTEKACVKCRTWMIPAKNNIVVLETFSDGFTPYKIWLADLLQCPDCKFELIAGFGRSPISEHYLPDFKNSLKRITHIITGCPRSAVSPMPQFKSPFSSARTPASDEACGAADKGANLTPKNQLCKNCGQWLGGGTACCSNPRSIQPGLFLPSNLKRS